MSNFKEIADEAKGKALGSAHVLVIGQTKSGKTDWVAQAVLDGWQVMYVDNDNGKSTLLAQLAGNDAALERVHYFKPDNMSDFVKMFFTSVVIRYGETSHKLVQSGTVADDEMVMEVRPALMPLNVILVIDSWTAMANSLIHELAAAKSIDLTEADRLGREIYGPTGFQATEIGYQIQQAPFHVIVQAHPGWYERKEKPSTLGAARNIDEKDMIIRETTAIPLSTSMPHGFTMGKFFNFIGWMLIAGTDRRELDFRIKKDTISGGNFPAGAKLNGDPRTEFRFSKLFGKPPVIEAGAKPWLVRMTGAEFKESVKKRNDSAPKATAVLAAKTIVTQEAKPETPQLTTEVKPLTALQKLKLGGNKT